jgi:polyisoprenoid-binding protein YceI
LSKARVEGVRAGQGFDKLSPNGWWFACVVALAPSACSAATFELDPDHSFVHFEVLHFGTSTSRGRIGPVRGTAKLDAAQRRGEVRLRIDVASVDTGLSIFNARLKQNDLLATVEHPEAYFVAERFVFDGDRVAEVRGEFTLRGVSQPLALQARRFACRTDEQQQRVCGGDFEAAVKRSEFGMTFGLPLIADTVKLLIQVEGRCTADC